MTHTAQELSDVYEAIHHECRGGKNCNHLESFNIQVQNCIDLAITEDFGMQSVNAMPFEMLPVLELITKNERTLIAYRFFIKTMIANGIAQGIELGAAIEKARYENTELEKLMAMEAGA